MKIESFFFAWNLSLLRPKFPQSANQHLGKLCTLVSNKIAKLHYASAKYHQGNHFKDANFIEN